MRQRASRWGLTVLFALLGCSDAEPELGEGRPDGGVSDLGASDGNEGDTGPAHGPDGGVAGAVPTALVLTWSPCPELLGQTYPGLECGRGKLPLDHEASGGPQVDLLVRRLPGAAPDGRFVVLLSGGPGFDGVSMLGLALELLAADPGLTAYLPDHRGTGGSSRLGCPEAEAPDSPGGFTYTAEEWAACGQALAQAWGEGLRHFNPSQAAHDVAALVEAERGEGEAAFVLGVSYGTLHAARYLALYPGHADGIIFDSVCAPGACLLDEQDDWENEVARRFFSEVCGASSACTERLGPDPWGWLEELHAKLRDGHCTLFSPFGPQNAASVRSVTAQLFLQADLRPALPALLYRLDRCEPEDIAALQTFFGGGGGGGGAGPDYSFPLAITAASQAMWSDTARSSDELAAALDELLVARGVSAQSAAQVAAWPSLQPRPDRYALPRASELPTLVVQAALDPATPVEIGTPLVSALAPGPFAQVLTIPHGSHNAVLQSRRLSDPERRCGLEAVIDFLANPRTEVGADCATDNLPPNFAGTVDYAQALFGRDSIWD